MPRAPHSMALLAGRPRAKRSVFSSRMCFCRSTPLQQADLDAGNLGHRREVRRRGVPDEGIRRVEVDRRRRRRRQPLQRLGDAGERGRSGAGPSMRMSGQA